MIIEELKHEMERTKNLTMQGVHIIVNAGMDLSKLETAPMDKQCAVTLCLIRTMYAKRLLEDAINTFNVQVMRETGQDGMEQHRKLCDRVAQTMYEATETAIIEKKGVNL